MWNKVTHDLGVISPGSKHEYTFTYNGPKKITSVTAGCSCTATAVDKNSVKVVFTAGSFPKIAQASNVSVVDVTKTVTVKFTDGSENKLKLTAKLAK